MSPQMVRTLAVLLLLNLWSAHAATRDNRIWPISGTSTPLPQSSPFGPRQKASENFRYDYHRGVDIPTPLGSNALAIDDGEVRLSGSYPGKYQDRVIQVKHTDPDTSTSYYSTYLHMQSESVKEGDKVTKGQVLGKTGASVSGFAHLHFEIRWDGLYQYNNINPWNALPYNNANQGPTTVTITQLARNTSIYAKEHYDVTVRCAVPNNELDFAGVSINTGTAVSGSTALTSRSIDFNALNLAVQVDYVKRLDGNIQNDIVIAPGRFSTSTAEAVWDFTFLGVPIADSVSSVTVVGKDVRGGEKTAVVDITTLRQNAPVGSPASPTPTPSTTGGSGNGASRYGGALDVLIAVVLLCTSVVFLG